MALAEATISFNLADLLGVDFDARRTKAWVTTNIPNETVIDTDGNKIRLGSGNVTINADGTGSFTTWTPGLGSNPDSWQTYLHVDYPDRNAAKGRKTRTFGPYTITASADLADLEEQQAVPPVYLTLVTQQLDAQVAEAQGYAEQARDISNIDTSDDAVEALVKGTAGAGPKTRAALTAATTAHADVAANTAARHTHSNKTVLDATTASFTTADETKLDGIQAGATANTVGTTAGTVAAGNDSRITGALQATAAPELIRDTIGAALVAGTNVTITPNDVSDTITIAASGGTGAPIARVSYFPAATTNITTTSTTMGDVDATNMAVTFTATSSAVDVVVEAMTGISGTANAMLVWSLRSGTTDVGEQRMVCFTPTTSQAFSRPRASFRVSGLTAGNSYTYKLGQRVTAGTGGTHVGGASTTSGTTAGNGPGIMEVFAR